jgi:sortase A
MARSRAAKTGLALMIAGLVCVVAAAVLVGYNLYDSWRAGNASDSVLGQVEDQMAGNSGASSSLSRIDYYRNPNIEMPTVEVDGFEYIGKLEIPALNLKLPVMSSWSYAGLNIAPCRYSGSAYMDDLVIAGHNFSSHFGSLKTLAMGDSVVFTDIDGNEFDYTVARVDRLDPTQVAEMKLGEYPLTLFTCTLNGASRVTVRCVAAN